jgi:hypothetical protein
MKKKTIGMLVLIIIAAGFMVFLQYRPLKTPANHESRKLKLVPNNKVKTEKSLDEVAVLNFESKQKSVVKNAKFSLPAMIDAKGKKISATELHIIFDPKILKLESIEPSKGFSLVLSGANIDSVSGKASVVVGVSPGGEAAEGNSLIANLNFQALSAGNSEVSFSQDSVASAKGSAGNVIAFREGILVTVK